MPTLPARLTLALDALRSVALGLWLTLAHGCPLPDRVALKSEGKSS